MVILKKTGIWNGPVCPADPREVLWVCAPVCPCFVYVGGEAGAKVRRKTRWSRVLDVHGDRCLGVLIT